MNKMYVAYAVVPNPVEVGWKMYAFYHPVHGRRYIGCFKKHTDRTFTHATEAFTLNCGCKGHPSEFFEFVQRTES